MKTVEQIKNEYAKEQGYESFEDFQINVMVEYDYINEHYGKIIQLVQDELKITQHVNLANLKLMLRSLKLCLEAHPDNEPNSEFEDRINDIVECNNILDLLLNTENIK